MPKDIHISRTDHGKAKSNSSSPHGVISSAKAASSEHTSESCCSSSNNSYESQSFSHHPLSANCPVQVGINALIYYSPTLLKSMSLDFNTTLIMAGILNTINLLGVGSTVYTMGKSSRFQLTLTSNKQPSTEPQLTPSLSHRPLRPPAPPPRGYILHLHLPPHNRNPRRPLLPRLVLPQNTRLDRRSNAITLYGSVRRIMGSLRLDNPS